MVVHLLLRHYASKAYNDTIGYLIYSIKIIDQLLKIKPPVNGEAFIKIKGVKMLLIGFLKQVLIS
jgi:hypothetical protein